MEELRKRLRSLKAADQKAIELLESLFVPVFFRRHWVLSHATGISTATLFYISEGLMQGTVSLQKKDYCLWIINRGFIIPGNGFLTSAKAEEFVEVLSDTKGYSLNLLRADTIARNNINMYRMLLEIYEEVTLEGRRREIMLRMKNATDRYVFFCENYPDLCNRLTLRQQAYYLHVDPKYFYSIRK